MLCRRVLCGVIAAMHFCVPAGAATNLVGNPGFEDEQQKPWNNGSKGCSLTTESPHSGSKCFKVEMQPSGGGSHGLFYCWQSIKGDWQGKTFKFGAWMRLVDCTSNCGITIKFYETLRGSGGHEKVHIIKWKKGTMDWTRFEGTYTAQATTKEILIYMLCSPGTGKAYCDDFYLELLDDPVPAAPTLDSVALVKLKVLSDALKQGAKVSVVLAQARRAAKSSNAELAAEGARVVECLEAWANGLLQEAKAHQTTDPLRTYENLKPLIDQMRYEPQGKEAVALLSELKRDAAFAKEIAAGDVLERLQRLEKALKGTPDEPAFGRTNNAILGNMATLIRHLQRSYAGTKAAATAQEIARKYWTQ